MDETDMSKKILGSQTDNEPEEKKTANWLADNVIWYVSKKGCDGGSTDERRGQKKGQKRR